MGNGMNPHVILCAPKTHYMIATCSVSHFLFLISYFHFLFPIPHSWFYTTRTNDTLSCARCRNIGFKPLTTQLTAKGRAARGRIRAAIWALRLLARESSYARTSNVRGQAERLAVIDRFSLCFFLSTMADGSAGPDGMSSSPSVTDLKDLIKDSLRELLQDEPALFSQASRGSRVASTESHMEVSFAVFATRTVFFLSVVDGGPRSAGRGVGYGPLLLGARGRPRGGGGRQDGRVGRIGGRGEASLSFCKVRAG